MKIIPVIDLHNGVVVSAQQGKRDAYQPIKSPLCPSSLIKDVLNRFLSVYPFETIYIADLNAITNNGNNQILIDKVINENQNINFWIDNGKKAQDLISFIDTNYKLIVGSECQNLSKFDHLTSHLKKCIISLDFFPNQGYTGPGELIKNSHLWSQEIIIMSLECVGENKGPDFERMKIFCQKYPKKDFIAAGGIRDETDLLKLREIGVNHALIASALHSCVINTNKIMDLSI